MGTYFEPGVVKPIFNCLATLLDEAIAWYLYQHVMDGYKFLMQNYNVGDKVCLFGSSGPGGGGPEGRWLTYCGFVSRVLAWRVHSPGARRNVAQGIIYLYTPSVSDTNTVNCAGRPALQR